MQTICTSYFVDPDLLNQGVPVEFLEKSNAVELTHEYEALLSPHEVGAKKNKQEAKKWMKAICSPNKPKDEVKNG